MPTPNIDHEPSSTDRTTFQQRETGYPWLFLYVGRTRAIGLIVTLLLIGLGGAFYVWYDQPGNNTAPASMVGLGYAVVGTIRSEEHTSELQSLDHISYAVFCLDRKSVV